MFKPVHHLKPPIQIFPPAIHRVLHLVLCQWLSHLTLAFESISISMNAFPPDAILREPSSPSRHAALGRPLTGSGRFLLRKPICVLLIRRKGAPTSPCQSSP